MVLRNLLRCSAVLYRRNHVVSHTLVIGMEYEVMGVNIKRCPWCQGDNVFPDCDDEHRMNHWVACGDCGATGGNQKTPERAVVHWNAVSDAVQCYGEFYDCAT